jgi:hypothetical protein
LIEQHLFDSVYATSLTAKDGVLPTSLGSRVIEVVIHPLGD